jgi:hypothetical protein
MARLNNWQYIHIESVCIALGEKQEREKEGK